MIISDIGMPEEDGYSLIRKVRASEAQKLGSIPAIALTAYTRGEDSQQAIDAGFQMHVAKPVEPTRLTNAVMSLLAAMSASPSHSIPQSAS
jgi:CheY-like chemotaxis protein